MKVKPLILTFFSFLLLNATNVKAQQFNFNDYIPSSPKSPNAAALGQYGDVPVSLYTGVPNIEIPIFEIKVGKFSMPISLSYHAGGNKVQDYPSWVGTGWVLNAGGVINRQQRGIIDELMLDGYNDNRNNVATIFSSPDISSMGDGTAPTSASEAMYEYGSNGIGYDTESDMFDCVLPNDNCKFYLDVLGAAHTLPANKLQIQVNGRTYANANNLFNDGAGRGNNCFQQWVVTDNQGVKYLYGTNATTQAYEVVENSQGPSTQPSTVNSWYLTEIDLPNGQKINFNYENSVYQIPMDGDKSTMSLGTTVIGVGSPASFEKMSTVRITNITFPGGKIDFLSGGYRADLPMDKVLDKINIYSQANGNYTLLKTYQINTNNLPNITPVQLTDNSNSFRLNLDSVVIIDNLQKRKGSYKMAYQSASLSRDAKMDFWGYYAGVPAFDPLSYLNFSSPLYQQLLNAPKAAVNPSTAQFDIINSITYPTGGTTYFTFESNQAVPNDPNILNNIGALIYQPTLKSFGYSLENDASGEASGFSPEFTTGNVIAGSVMLPSSHELFYSGQGCPINSQCFSLLLYKRNSDGTYTGQPVTLVNNNVVPVSAYTTYKIQIKWQSRFNQGQAYVNVNWLEYPSVSMATPVTVNVGGLRVKKIQSIDPISQTSVTKTYEYLNDVGYCSGSISALPIYYYYYPLVMYGNGFYPRVFTATSQNQSSLFNTSGSGVGYSQVTEYNSTDGSSGKTVYKYTSNDLSQPGYADVGVAEANAFPFPPVTSYEWRRGKLLSKYVYANINGVYQPVEQTDITYTFLGSSDANYLVNSNIKIIKNAFVHLNPDPSSPYTYQAIKDFYKYNTVTEAYYTSATTQKIFDNKNYLTSTVVNTSNVFDHAALTNSSTSTSQSNGNTTTQQYKYAADYTNAILANDDASLGIKNLLFFNQVSMPVEQINIIQYPNGQSYVTGGSLLVYDKDKPVLRKYYVLKLASPVLLASFSMSSINSSGQFVYDGRYELTGSLDGYNGDFNPAQESKYTSAPTAYQWGYNGQYMVAQAVNASGKDIFYDSFEEGDGNSSAGDAKTGHYSFNGSYSKALNNLDNGSYKLTYWLKTGGIWVQQNQLVTASGSYTINISGQIDDVCFYPSGAQMNVYTYDPLVGVTSMTDIRGMTTYYEYDSFQRLTNIRDKDGNIVKHTDYHYQSQTN